MLLNWEKATTTTINKNGNNTTEIRNKIVTLHQCCSFHWETLIRIGFGRSCLVLFHFIRLFLPWKMCTWGANRFLCLWGRPKQETSDWVKWQIECNNKWQRVTLATAHNHMHTHIRLSSARQSHTTTGARALRIRTMKYTNTSTKMFTHVLWTLTHNGTHTSIHTFFH